jgi:ribose transport system substrate-binding protein
MSKSYIVAGSLMASAALTGLSATSAKADDDAYMKTAKDYIVQATAPVTQWDGPTTGPKAQGKKLVIYVSTDQRNGGAQGVGDGAAEAAKALGWDFRIRRTGVSPGAHVGDDPSHRAQAGRHHSRQP